MMNLNFSKVIFKLEPKNQKVLKIHPYLRKYTFYKSYHMLTHMLAQIKRKEFDGVTVLLNSNIRLKFYNVDLITKNDSAKCL